jgi:hypothetical protein
VSPRTRRVCSIRTSSAMPVLDRRTSSANGAFGRHERQDSDGIRLVIAASTVAVERAQVNVSRGAAGGAIDPQEVVPSLERCADGRCEQEGACAGLGARSKR